MQNINTMVQEILKETVFEIKEQPGAGLFCLTVGEKSIWIPDDVTKEELPRYINGM